MSLTHQYSVKKSRARFFAVALLFLLSGCQKSNWKTSAIHGSNEASYSTRISREAIGNPYIEFEVVKTQEGEKGYLLFHIDRIQGSEDHPDQVTGSLTSNELERTFTASKLRGGQRILLPSEMTTLILSQLGKGHTVEIVLDRFGLKISPDGFEKAFKQLHRKQPWLKLPNIAMDWSTN